MIVKISSGGKSFKGLSDYLTHDPDRAKTDERVAWTHTLNCAEDHVPSAVNEMYLTTENAELLKQEAGVRAGGRSVESPVKHASLNWAPGEEPSHEHMIQTSQQFLDRMGWQEHQAILVAHDDKTYRHVHLMVNSVHPETGLCLNDAFEQRRAQAWALEYERSQDRIQCTERLKNAEERERNMPRNVWKEFQDSQKEFERGEKTLAENSPEIPANPKNAEWKILKEFQRGERLAFFAQGKSEYSQLRNSIYREVREEFRGRWNEFYELRREGADAAELSTMKTQLVAEQKAELGSRRDIACAELRESRDERYRELLESQKEQRGDLRWRQEAGLDNAPFLNELEQRKAASEEIRLGFREAAGEVGAAWRAPEVERTAREIEDRGEESTLGARGPARADIDPAGRATHAIGGFFMTLADDFINFASAPPQPMSARETDDLFREAAESALKQQQKEVQNEEDERWRIRQKELYGER